MARDTAITCSFAGLLALLGALAWATPGLFPSNSIRSDGEGYHAWTRALVTGDFSFCAVPSGLEYMISHQDLERGVCQNKYPMGLALMRLPVMGLLLDRSKPRWFISPAEHLANQAFGIGVLVAGALLTLYSAGRVNPVRWEQVFAVGAVIFGTGWFHYATFDATFTHAYAALVVAALIALLLHPQASRPSLWMEVSAAILCFFLVQLRNTDVLLVCVFALSSARIRGREDAAGSRLVKLARAFLAPLAGAGIGVGIQLLYNRWASGGWNLSSYGDEGFLWNRPNHFRVLFSYERGLFTWYPLVAVILLSALPIRSIRSEVLTLVATVGVFVLMYGFWSTWYLGGGFGHRGFVDIAPGLAVVFAATLRNLTRVQRRLVVLLSLGCVVATSRLMWAYWEHRVPYDHTTGRQYWSALLAHPK
jgi:hypothetical protein